MEKVTEGVKEMKEEEEEGGKVNEVEGNTNDCDSERKVN